ncbi:hypothetical protein AAVH_39843 [Aphelenchoides avenae]|nr:hypothetical protein AAVH_39843 [Aphelenchus avenae]
MGKTKRGRKLLLPGKRTTDFALPPEILWNICEKLTRRDIEAALFVRRSFRDAINCHSDGPRRQIESLMISEPTDQFPFMMRANKSTIGEYAEEYAERSKVEEAVAIMKSCNVNKLSIDKEVTVDDCVHQRSSSHQSILGKCAPRS